MTGNESLRLSNTANNPFSKYVKTRLGICRGGFLRLTVVWFVCYNIPNQTAEERAL